MSSSGEDRVPGLRDRVAGFRERLRRHPVLNTSWQIGVFAVGVTVLGAGVAMLVLPGPGWVAIFLGFAILATEFAWAQTALHMARQAAQKALDPAVRRRNTITAVALGVLAGAAIIVYLTVFGLNLPWNA